MKMSYKEKAIMRMCGVIIGSGLFIGFRLIAGEFDRHTILALACTFMLYLVYELWQYEKSSKTLD